MRSRFKQILAVVFVLSLVATPHSALVAQEQSSSQLATPITSVPEDEEATPGSHGAESPGLEVVPGTPDGNTEGSQPESEISVGTPGADQLSRQNSDMGSLASAPGNYLFGLWDFVDGHLVGVLAMFPEFAAESGDTLTIYYSSDSLSLAPGSYPLAGIPAVATANDVTETLTITFTADYAPELPGDGGPALVDVAFPGTITFPGCVPTETEYTNQAYVEITQPSPNGDWFRNWFWVDGDTCEPSVAPVVTDLHFEPVAGLLVIYIDIDDAGVAAGTELTITYPAHLMTIQSDPVEVIGGLFTDTSVGTAIASDGVITITFNDYFPDPEDEDPALMSSLVLFMSASINSAAICADIDETQEQEIGRIYFVASSGGTFVYSYSTSQNGDYENTILCNGAPASITGVLNADGSEILWTLDTGDLINGGYISLQGTIDSGVACDQAVVTIMTDGTTFSKDCGSVEYSYGEITLEGSPVGRAIITFSSPIDPLLANEVYMVCAAVQAQGFDPRMEPMSSNNTDGLGAYICDSVFPPGGGDFLTISSIPNTVYPGDEITFTASFETTTYLWFSMVLNTVLPQSGFEDINVICTFEPVDAQQTGDCNEDNGIVSFGLSQFGLEGGPTVTQAGIMEAAEEPHPGRISVEITGTVTATPGDTLEFQTCGQRSLSIPGIPLELLLGLVDGEVQCSSATTQVVPVTQPMTLEISSDQGELPDGLTYEINEVGAAVTMFSFAQGAPGISGTVPANGIIDLGDLPIGSSYTVTVQGQPAGFEDVDVTRTFDVEPGISTWILNLQLVPDDTTPVPSPTPSPTGTTEPDETPTETPTSTTVPDETPTGTVDPDEPTTPSATVTAEPTESPTVPGTPAATPTTVPGESDGDPTATSGVTGLPSTGSSGPSATSLLFVATMAAGILIAAGIGIQLRPRD